VAIFKEFPSTSRALPTLLLGCLRIEAIGLLPKHPPASSTDVTNFSEHLSTAIAPIAIPRRTGYEDCSFALAPRAIACKIFTLAVA